MSNNQETKVLSVENVLKDLENGLTRTAKDKNYNATKGCIQDKYGLTNFEVKMLFKDERLKNRKVAYSRVDKTISFVLVDKIEDATTTETVVEETPIVVDEAPIEEVVIAQEGEVVNNQGW